MTAPHIPHDSIDALIARQLPDWLSKARSADLQVLHQSLLAQQRAQHALNQQLGPLMAIDRFAEPLLVKALKDRTGLTLDVRRSTLFVQWNELRPVVPASLPLPVVQHRHTQSLLAAALHNFAEPETVAGAFATGSALTDETGRLIGLSPGAFAQLCRTLDVGQAYQDYLRQRFLPCGALGTESQSASMLDTLLEAQLRTRLEVDVRLACLKGEIDAATSEHLLALTVVPAPMRRADAMPSSHQLYVLGHKLHGGMAFSGQVSGVIAWLPGDTPGALIVAASWEALYQAIGRRLREPDYARRFLRFIGEAEKLAFTAALDACLQADPGSSTLQLDGRALAIKSTLLGYLRQVHVAKVQGDARALAVPTDDEDRQVRSRRLQGLLAAGLDLLGLAALVVPGLGEVMLGVAAIQVAHEVYEGYEAWQLGDREAALGHLFAVARGLAEGAVIGGSTALAGKALARVAFVDDLCPVSLDSKRMRLCDGRLGDYRQATMGHAIGELAGTGAQRSLTLPQGRYRVQRRQPGEPWRIIHPGNTKAFAPRLANNGAGGWWHALERPQQWRGAQELLRRLGSEFSDVTQTQAQALLQATAYDEARLRRLLLEDAEPPARLVDGLERMRLHARSPDLPPEAIELALASDVAPLPGESILRRHFPGLSRRSANEVLKGATADQVRILTTSRKVPLAMAERIRWQVRACRLDKAREGLRRGRMLSRDSERLTLGLLDHLAPWPAGIRLELRDTTVEGALLVRSGKASAPQLHVVLKQGNGYLAADAEGRGVPGAQSGDRLGQALLWHLRAPQRALLGDAASTADTLIDHLAAKLAWAQELAAGWIGLADVGTGVRPPVRWGDGRLGYALSGRPGSSRQALEQGIRQVYPTFDDAQLQRYVSERLQTGDNLWSHVNDLHQQLRSLESALATWQREAGDVAQMTTRSRVAGQLLRCWRRQSPMMGDGYHLLIDGESLDCLPVLPAEVSFSHVKHLSLRNLGLSTIDSTFLSRFNGLRRLELDGNRLSSLTDALGGLRSLVELDLSDNNIHLDTQANRTLARLTALEVLHLDRNPLGLQPELRDLVRLRRVHLRATGLTSVPNGLLRLSGLEYADLRDNRIVTLEQTLFTLPRRRLEHIALHDNPLSRASLAQLDSFQQAGRSPLRRLQRHLLGDTAARDAWLKGLDNDARAMCLAQWDNLAHEDGSGDLLRLLSDLRDTQDARQRFGALRSRVWAVVQACEQDARLRSELFELAARPRSCTDSVALNFSYLEVRAQVHGRTAGQSGMAAEPSLLRLGRELFRLEQMERLVALDIQDREEAGDVFDEVEVRLAYRVNLRESLELPGQPDDMRYENCAQVSAQEVEQMREQILGAENPAQLSMSLAGHRFWQEHLLTTYAQRFTASDLPFYQRLESLAEALDDMAEGEYLEAIDRVAEAREAARRALIEQLTLEAWRRFLD